MKRFAVAARELEGGPRGMSRWLAEVLAAWQAAGRGGDFSLHVERALPPGFDATGFEVIATGPGPGGGATTWEQWTLARRLRADHPRAVLGPANSVPLAHQVPSVVVIHDLSFEAHPEWFGLREGSRRRLLARTAVRRSRLVVTPSLFTRREIERLYGAGAGARVRVAPLGVSPRFRPIVDPRVLAETRRRLALDGEIVLAVGSLFQRRHPEELIAGFARLLPERQDLRLVLVGDNRTHPPLDLERLFAAAGIAHRTTWIESVDDETLLALYGLARVTTYLSDYEGFGLPPLEALACGSAVVASATGALAENLAGHVVFVRDHTPEAIAAALGEVLTAPAPPRIRPDWIDARFSWAATAAIVLQALEDAAG